MRFGDKMAQISKFKMITGVSAIVLAALSPVNYAVAAPDSIIEVYKQWNYQCQFVTAVNLPAVTKNCEVVHHLNDSTGKRILSVAFTWEDDTSEPPNGFDQSGIKATLVTPPGVNLRVVPELVVERLSELPIVWNAQYSTCVVSGCIADLMLNPSHVGTLSSGVGIQVRFGMVNVGPIAELNLPVDGLEEALEALIRDDAN